MLYAFQVLYHLIFITAYKVGMYCDHPSVPISGLQCKAFLAHSQHMKGGLQPCSKLKVNCRSAHVFSPPGSLVEGANLILGIFSWWNNVKYIARAG